MWLLNRIHTHILSAYTVKWCTIHSIRLLMAIITILLVFSSPSISMLNAWESVSGKMEFQMVNLVEKSSRPKAPVCIHIIFHTVMLWPPYLTRHIYLNYSELLGAMCVRVCLCEAIHNIRMPLCEYGLKSNGISLVLSHLSQRFHDQIIHQHRDSIIEREEE